MRVVRKYTGSRCTKAMICSASNEPFKEGGAIVKKKGEAKKKVQQSMRPKNKI